MLQVVVHYSLHFLLPVAIAYFFYAKHWKKGVLILWATMFIDLDHLLVSPIFDPDRCSVGFHLLHNYWALTIYILLLFFKKTRIVAIGLVLHIIADALDCYWMGLPLF
jgi:hypothetical protein